MPVPRGPIALLCSLDDDGVIRAMTCDDDDYLKVAFTPVENGDGVGIPRGPIVEFCALNPDGVLRAVAMDDDDNLLVVLPEGQLPADSGLTVLDVEAAYNTIVNTIVETTICTFTVPADALDTDNYIIIRILGIATNKAGGNTTFTWRLKFGATTVITNALTVSSNATDRDHIITIMFRNYGDNQSQLAHMKTEKFFLNVPSGYEGIEVNRGTASEDSTGDLTLAVTLQLGHALSTVSFGRRFATATLHEEP